MRCVTLILGSLMLCASAHAQNFPTSLVTHDKALACNDPGRLADVTRAVEKKNPRAMRRTGCTTLRGGMEMSVELAQRVTNKDYYLVRVRGRRGPALWAYSYDFKR